MKKYLKQFKTTSLFLVVLFSLPVISSAIYHTDDIIDGNSLIDTNATSNTDVDLDVDLDLSATTTATTTATSTATTTTETEMRNSVGLRVNASGVAVVTSAQVESEADLEIFSENVALENNAIDRVVIEEEEDESKVTVVYRHPARLFGFIPVSIRSVTTVIMSEETEMVEVDSKLSWWSFLAIENNYESTEIETLVQNNAVVAENARVDASAAAKARVAEAVILEIEAFAEAEAFARR